MSTSIRIIQDQQTETKPVEVNGYEAEQLLRKYAPNQKFTTHQQPVEVVNNQLTFEEMVAQEEEKMRVIRENQLNKNNAPKPITFDGGNGYESEVKYKSDDSGFGFKVNISTDMKLPNY